MELVQLFGLENRTIIVTGGTGGLGASLCRTLMLAGADVVCTDIFAEPPADLWSNLKIVADQKSRILTYHACDVTDELSVNSVFDKADSDARFAIRGLVTCAGISGRVDALDYPVDAFRKIIDVNLTGTFLCARSAARIFHTRMVEGSIVMLASMSGHVVNQGVNTCAYNASKAAVIQLGKNLASEWGNDERFPPIRVNTLSPGYIFTPISEPTMNQLPGLRDLWTNGNMLRRLSTVEEHQASVLFLLGDGSSYITAADLDASAGHTAW